MHGGEEARAEDRQTRRRKRLPVSRGREGSTMVDEATKKHGESRAKRDHQGVARSREEERNGRAKSGRKESVETRSGKIGRTMNRERKIEIR